MEITTQFRPARRFVLPLMAALLCFAGAHIPASADSPVTPQRLPAPTISISTNAPNGATGGASVTGTVTVTNSLDLLGSMLGSAAQPDGPAALTLATRTKVVLAPDGIDSPSAGLQVALATPCLDFFGSCPPPPVTLPASITVQPGVAKSFTIATSPVTAERDVAISATFGGVTSATRLPVRPPQMASLTLQPSTITLGDSFVATACLNGAAPAAGANIDVENGNPFVGGFGGALLSIDAGDKCGNLPVSTPTPAEIQQEGAQGGPGTTTLTAHYLDSSAKATLHVNNLTSGSGTGGSSGSGGGSPIATLQSITIDGRGSELVQSSPSSPATVTVAVILSAAAPSGGTTVAISSHGPVEPGDTAAPYLSPIPASIKVNQGQTAASFQLQVSGCPSYTSSVYCDTEIDATFQGITKEAVIITQ